MLNLLFLSLIMFISMFLLFFLYLSLKFLLFNIILVIFVFIIFPWLVGFSSHIKQSVYFNNTNTKYFFCFLNKFSSILFFYIVLKIMFGTVFIFDIESLFLILFSNILYFISECSSKFGFLFGNRFIYLIFKSDEDKDLEILGLFIYLSIIMLSVIGVVLGLVIILGLIMRCIEYFVYGVTYCFMFIRDKIKVLVKMIKKFYDDNNISGKLDCFKDWILDRLCCLGSFIKEMTRRFFCWSCSMACKFCIIFFKYWVKKFLWGSLDLCFFIICSFFRFIKYCICKVFYFIKLVFKFLYDKFFVKIERLFVSFRGTCFYCNTFGVLEGVVYRFCLYNNLGYKFSKFYKGFIDICGLGCSMSFITTVFEIVIIFIFLFILFCTFYTYVVTIGSHMDFAINFIIRRCDKGSNNVYVCFLICFSFVLVYLSSIIFVVCSVLFIIFLLVRLFLCFSNLRYKFNLLVLCFTAIISHMEMVLERKVIEYTTISLLKELEKLEDIFQYDQLFNKNKLEKQELELDAKEIKENPDKFYYKKLFMDCLCVLSFTFCFVIMFAAYVYNPLPLFL